MNIHITLKSSNVKTGPIPVTTSEKSTCPSACPLKAGGCYARGGPLGIHWAAVSNGTRGNSLAVLSRQIRSFPVGQVWRHNQAGDLPGLDNAIDSRGLKQLVDANRGRRGFTYTHKPCEGDGNLETSNRASVRYANANGFAVNLSANSMAHADRLADLNAGPVVCIVPESTPESFTTPAGRRGIICPAQQRDDITCSKCQMCQRATRSIIIGFRAHGSAKRKAEAISKS